MTQPQAPPFDVGNRLLAEGPAELTTVIADTPAGQRLFLTVRTSSGSQTVLLAGPDARNWAQMLTKTAESMSVAGLIVANGKLP